MNHWIAVFIGGGAGSIARYAISVGMLRSMTTSAFPWATLISNLTSTAILGLLVWRFGVNAPDRESWKALLAVGFCGGFSTFSTFSFETLELFRQQQHLMAIANVAISVVACVVLLYLIARTA